MDRPSDRLTDKETDRKIDLLEFGNSSLLANFVSQQRILHTLNRQPKTWTRRQRKKYLGKETDGQTNGHKSNQTKK